MPWRGGSPPRRGRGRPGTVGVDPDRLAAPGGEESSAIDLRPVVDEELGRLPEKYRARWSSATWRGGRSPRRRNSSGARWGRSAVGSRGRGRSCGRGCARGLGAPAAVAALAASEAGAVAVPPALLGATLRAAMALAGGSAVPASILQLTRGVALAMIAEKLKLAGAVALSTAVVLTAAVGYVSGRGQDPPRRRGRIRRATGRRAPTTSRSPRAPRRRASRPQIRVRARRRGP